METHLRFILLLSGIMLLAYVIWDLRRHHKLKKQRLQEARTKEIESLQRKQKELHFSNKFVIDDSEEFFPEQQSNVYHDKEIINLFIIARDPKGFVGKKLKQIFETANLVYGKMNIFHRFKDDEQNEILFSVASAVEPGTFNLHTLNNQNVLGLSLFMIPSKVIDPKNVFEVLVKTAKQLAFNLNGELRDQHHRPLTLQIIEQYKKRLEVGFGSAK